MHRSAVVRSEEDPTQFTDTLVTLAPDTSTPASRSKSVAQHELAEAARVRAMEEGYQLGMTRGRKAGMKQGYEEGLVIGRHEAAEQSTALHAQALAEFQTDLNRVVEDIRAAIPRFYEASESKMADLAMDAVRKLLAAELEISRDSALAIVKEALTEVTYSSRARVRINVRDRSMIETHRAEVMAATSSIREIEFVDDPSLVAGCVVETEGGVVDASIETKLDLMDDAVRRSA